MDRRLKQRLVGASVLVALVVIFVPELFDDRSSPSPTVNELPLAPKEFSSRIVPLVEGELSAPGADESGTGETPMGPAPVEEPLEAVKSDPVEPGEDTAESVESSSPELGSAEERSGAKRTPVPRSKPLPASSAGEEVRMGLIVWAIQLGSFSRGQNALGLRDSLRAQGYTAFVQSAYSSQGTITRVFVGPELHRDEAEATRKKLEAKQSLNGIVVRYPGMRESYDSAANDAQ